jgi:hypothetical protein
MRFIAIDRGKCTFLLVDKSVHVGDITLLSEYGRFRRYVAPSRFALPVGTLRQIPT